MSELKTNFWSQLLKKLLKIIADNLGRKSSAQKTHNQHVVPHEEGWAVKGAGNSRITSKHRLQSRAIKRAEEIAQNYNSDVIIHREDGTIRDRRSY